MKKYNITTDQLENIEQLVSYYHRFSVEDIQEKHPGFIVEDFQKLLKIVEEIITEEQPTMDILIFVVLLVHFPIKVITTAAKKIK